MLVFFFFRKLGVGFTLPFWKTMMDEWTLWKSLHSYSMKKPNNATKGIECFGGLPVGFALHVISVDTWTAFVMYFCKINSKMDLIFWHRTELGMQFEHCALWNYYYIIIDQKNVNLHDLLCILQFRLSLRFAVNNDMHVYWHDTNVHVFVTCKHL